MFHPLRGDIAGIDLLSAREGEVRIAQVIKAKRLTPGVRVLVFDAEGNPAWNRVVAVDEQFDKNWLDVELEGVKGSIDIEAKTRVVVWK